MSWLKLISAYRVSLARGGQILHLLCKKNVVLPVFICRSTVYVPTTRVIAMVLCVIPNNTLYKCGRRQSWSIEMHCQVAFLQIIKNSCSECPVFRTRSNWASSEGKSHRWNLRPTFSLKSPIYLQPRLGRFCLWRIFLVLMNSGSPVAGSCEFG
jgi:hypothetical protein